MQLSSIKNKIKRSMVHAKIEAREEVRKEEADQVSWCCREKSFEKSLQNQMFPTRLKTHGRLVRLFGGLMIKSCLQIMLVMNLVHISAVFKHQNFWSQPHVFGALEETNLLRSYCLWFQMRINTSEEHLN